MSERVINLNPWHERPAVPERQAYDLLLIGGDNTIFYNVWPTNKGRFYRPTMGFVPDHIIQAVRLSIEPESNRL